jgi:hypothetical protein
MQDVYDAKERFLDIWLAENKNEARFLYSAWKTSVQEHVQRYFTDIFTAFENWHNEIFNYWDYKFTNAFTEALNNGIRAVYSSGYGYSFEVLRAKLLYTNGTHKLFKKKGKFNRKLFESTASFERMTFFTGSDVTETTETINYGVDISKLLEFIKAGKI